MATPEYHIFLCAQQRAEGNPCSERCANGGEILNDAFTQVLTQNHLTERVALTRTGCVGPCKVGANVLIYPGSVMYSEVEPADAVAIIRHLLVGKPWADKLATASLG